MNNGLVTERAVVRANGELVQLELDVSRHANSGIEAHAGAALVNTPFYEEGAPNQSASLLSLVATIRYAQDQVLFSLPAVNL